jgi:hypothetical protein
VLLTRTFKTKFDDNGYNTIPFSNVTLGAFLRKFFLFLHQYFSRRNLFLEREHSASIRVFVWRSVGPLVRWSVGPSVHWSVGPLVRWSVGPLVHQSVGSSVCWSVSQLVHRFVGPSVPRSPYHFECILLSHLWTDRSEIC